MVDSISYNIIGNDSVEVTARKYQTSTLKGNPPQYNINYYHGDIAIPSTVTYQGIIFKVVSIGSDAFSNCEELTGVTIPNTITSVDAQIFSGCGRLKTITIPGDATIDTQNLSDSTNIYVNVGSETLLYLWNQRYTPYEIGTDTKLYAPSLSYGLTTQTTASFDLRNYYKEYNYVYQVYRNGELYSYSSIDLDSTSTFKITRLLPQTEYRARVVVSKNNARYYTAFDNCTTSYIGPQIEATVTASSISIRGTYVKDELYLYRHHISFGDTYIYGSKVDTTGLEPGQSFKVTYTIEVKTSRNARYYYAYSTTKTISTAELAFETQQPKVINEGNVIVQAKSNIDDTETNVGFEWRRTDWTDEFASNTGNGYLYDGIMEGYIRNLNASYLWKYRPYYESRSGNKYYGEWVGIDPGNTSYFEPTVHTYANVSVNGNSAQVKGYAQRGTDNITSQGFVYWKTGSSAKANRLSADDATDGTDSNAKAMATATAPSDAQTVEVRGTVMETTLSGLEFNSNYSYAAYVTTSEGETFYGEERSFTTGDDPTGIESVKAETGSHSYTAGIYDLNGRKLDSPQRGVNIIRFEDGTVKKILVK